MSEGNTKTWQTPCKCSFCFDYRMNQTFQYVSGWVNLWDTIWMFFFSLDTEKVEKCKVCVNSVFSLTWPASMQIYWNKKKSVYIRKEFNSQRTGLGHKHSRRFIVLGHKYGRRDVMWKHNIFTKGAKNRLFVEPSCSTCPVASVVPPPCASLTSSAAIPSTFCSSPFVWLYSGCPPSVTVWEKSYKQSISVCRYKQTKTLVFKHCLLL